ncbi:MAG: hypothetical protein LUH15_03405 [Tannerellaceae bacterium]|nr:hypothetical protein [Tannerellaceae bacterium]
MGEILVKHGLKRTLIKECNASYPTIRKALQGKGSSLKTLEIREKALELGGREIKEDLRKK